MPNKKQKANLIVRIDEDVTTIIVQNGNKILYSSRLTANTKRMDEAITKFFGEQLGFVIGKRTAKAVRTEVGSAVKLETQLKIHVQARVIGANTHEDIIVTDRQIRKAIAESVKDIVDGVRIAIEQIPLTVGLTLANLGILLRGEGSKLRGLDQRLSQETGLSVTLAYK